MCVRARVDLVSSEMGGRVGRVSMAMNQRHRRASRREVILR